MEIIDVGKYAKMSMNMLESMFIADIQKGIYPTLSVVQTHKDPASQIYLNNIIKDCERFGISLHIHTCDNVVDYCKTISSLNQDEHVDGIIMMRPFHESFKPSDIQACEVMLNPRKDIDGANDYNIGKATSLDEPYFFPATAVGMGLLTSHLGISPIGKHVVIIGRSKTVGLAAFAMYTRLDATCTLAHSKSEIERYTPDADIIVAATNQPHLITADMKFKPGAVILDAGICVGENNTITGNVDIESFRKNDTDVLVTPVPRGLGLMTRAALWHNLYKAIHME